MDKPTTRQESAQKVSNVEKKRLAIPTAAAVLLVVLLPALRSAPADANVDVVTQYRTLDCGSFPQYDCPATSNPVDIFFATDTITGQKLLYTVTQGIGGVHPDQFKFYVHDADTLANVAILGTIDPSTETPDSFLGIKRPEQMAYNPNTNQIFMTRSWADNVAVLTGVIGGVGPTFEKVIGLDCPTGYTGISSRPVYLALNPVTNRVYVPRPGNFGSFYYHDMVVIDGNTRSCIANIGLEDSATGVAVDHLTNLIYVGRPNKKDIAIIDGATNQPVGNIDVGGPMSGIALDPYTKKLYVTHSCTIATCDPAGAENPSGGDPNPVENSVSVVDVAQKKKLYSIRTGIGLDPRRVKVEPSSGRVYVANYQTSDVSIIDEKTDSVYLTVTTRRFPTAIATDPNGDRFWVTSSGFSVPFDQFASERAAINIFYDSPIPGGAPKPSHFFAEGTTRAGFQNYLTLYSPDMPQNVEITYAVGPGQGGNIVKTYGLPPRSRVTIDVNAEIGPDKDVSILAKSVEGKVFFGERVLYYNGVVIDASDGSAAPGESNFWTARSCVPSPCPGPAFRGTYPGPSTHDSYFFPEGTTRPGFKEYLTLYSPFDDQSVNITYMLGPGQGAPINKTVFLPRSVRITIDVNSQVGPGKDVSTKVVSPSGKPFFAERPMYWDSMAVGGILTSGGHNGQGMAPDAITDVVFAEGTTRAGFRTFYTLVSETDQTVRGTFMLGQGQGSAFDQDFELPANTRVTLELESIIGPEKDASVRFKSLDDEPFFAERPMYFNGVVNGASGGTVGPGQWNYGDFRVQRRTDYYFAEGTNRTIVEGFDVLGGAQAYLLMASPDITNTVHVEIDSSTGEFIQQVVEVPKGNRVTVDLNFPVGFQLGQNVDYSMRIQSKTGQPFFAERAVFFKNFVGTRGATLSAGSHN
jgi:YVTN family beta-propeller protein